MSEVKRFTESCGEGGGVAPKHDGELVYFRDYDALAQQLAASQARENVATSAMNLASDALEGANAKIAARDKRLAEAVGLLRVLSSPDANLAEVQIAMEQCDAFLSGEEK